MKRSNFRVRRVLVNKKGGFASLYNKPFGVHIHSIYDYSIVSKKWMKTMYIIIL